MRKTRYTCRAFITEDPTYPMIPVHNISMHATFATNFPATSRDQNNSAGCRLQRSEMLRKPRSLMLIHAHRSFATLRDALPRSLMLSNAHQRLAPPATDRHVKAIRLEANSDVFRPSPPDDDAPAWRLKLLVTRERVREARPQPNV